MAAGWKRILTTEDGTLATSDQTIEAGESRNVTMASNTLFTIKTSNVDGSYDNGALLILTDSATSGALDTLTLQADQTKLRVTGASDSVSGSLSFKEADDNGSFMITLAAPASLGANETFVLPATDGTSGQALVTDGSGNLSFSTISGGGSIDGSGDSDRMAYWSDADTLTFSNKFEVDDSTGQVALGALVAQTSKGTGAVTGESGNFNRIIVGAATGSTIGNTGGGSRFFSKFGTGTVTAGKVHYKTSTNTWAVAANDDLTEASSLLAVADSTASSQIMLKEGAVKMASNQGFSTASRGAPLYLASVGGAVTSTVPAAGSNPVYVRIVGYVIDASNAIIYFDPDKSWVEI